MAALGAQYIAALGLQYEFSAFFFVCKIISVESYDFLIDDSLHGYFAIARNDK